MRTSKKTIAKLFVVMLVAMQMFTSAMPMHASSNVNIENISDWAVDTSDGHWGQANIIYVDGKVGFCLDAMKNFPQGTSTEIRFEDLGISVDTRRTLSLIANFGYYENPTTNNYALTQGLIWDYLDQNSRYVSSSYPTKESQQGWRDVVMAKVDAYQTYASFDNQTYTINVDEPFTLTDTSGVLSSMNLINDGGLYVEHNGNSITVMANANTPDPTTVQFKKPIAFEGIPFVVEQDGKQAVAVLSHDDPVRTAVQFTINKLGSLELAKKDEEGKFVPNTQFTLSYNSDMSNPIGTYTTKGNGKVTVEGLNSGTVYVQEIAVPGHLVLDSSIESVTIIANETITYTKINTYKKGYIEVTKADKETSKTVLQEGVTFDIYTSAGKYVETITTSKNGIAKSSLLDYGKYTVVETKAPNGYLINVTAIETFIELHEQTHQVRISNERVYGNIIVNKVDAKTGTTSQGDASLVGAQYSLYAKEDIKSPIDGSVIYAKNALIDTVVIAQDLQIVWTNMPIGTYYVKETKAPEGYLLDETAYEIDLHYIDQNTKEIKVEVTSKEQVIRGQIEVTKKDDRSGEIVELAGTIFNVLYDGKVVETIETNDKGIATTSMLPYGKYTIVEIEAPYGYTINNNVLTTFIKENNQTYAVEVSNASVRGTATLTKCDGETETTPQGNASLVGAVYGLYAQDDILNPANGKVIYQAGTLISKKTTTEALELVWGDLYLGKYYFQEVTSPVGYLLDETKHALTLTYENQNVAIVTGAAISKERVMKQAFELIKISTNGTNGETPTLANAEFTIKLESDVIAVGWDNAPTYDVITSDSKGYALSKELPYGVYRVKETKVPNNVHVIEDFFVTITEDSRTPQTYRIFNDAPFTSYIKMVKKDADTKQTVTLNSATFQIKDEQGNVVTQKVGNKKVDTFTTDETGTVTTPLPLDAGTYYIEEIETPKGFLTLDKPVTFRITNTAVVEVDEDGDPVVTVEIFNAQPKATIKLTKTFEASKHIENKVAKFELRALLPIVSAIDGSTLYEAMEVIPNPNSEDGYYYVADGETLEINNLPIGVLGSMYTLKEVETTEGYVLSQSAIVYSFTQKDETTAVYEVSKELDNTLIRTDIQLTKTDAYSKEIVKELEGFVFELTMGDTITTASINPKTGVAIFKDIPYGQTVSIREIATNEEYYLSEEVKEILVDRNLTGIGEVHTIEYENIPVEKMGTTAKDSETNSNQGANREEITIIDTVEYINLSTEKEYTIKGVLMDKVTNEPLLVNGEEVRSEVTFIPKTHDGFIELPFTFDGSAIAGTTVVVFEELYYDTIVVASHTDIDDEGQTVYFPEIGTTAKDSETNSNQGANREEITIIDTVEYTNLSTEKEYTIKGVLMDKATNEPLLVNGEEVRSEVTFIPQAPDGFIELPFTFDGSAIAGTTVVVFEELYYDAIVVANHTDIDDEGQTVYFPEIGTTAVDKESSTHVAQPNEKVTIIDTVAYENLIVGNEYTIKGVLMDKATEKPLVVDGKEITAEVTFVAESENGSIELEFTFNAKAVAGTTVVVFEEMYENDIEVASHTDINDQGQTVVIENLPVIPQATLTGDNTSIMFYAGLVMFALGGLIGVVVSSKRSKLKDYK